MSTDELQQKDIKYLQKEFDRLENSMAKGFSEIQSELRILSSSYIKRSEVELKLDGKASLIDLARVELLANNNRSLIWKISLAVTAISSVIGIGSNLLL